MPSAVRNSLSSVLMTLACFIPMANAVTAIECQAFLEKQPIRTQCGPTCLTHAVVGILEPYQQQSLSVEYALLAQLIQQIRSVTPSSAKEAIGLRSDFEETKNKLSSGSMGIDSVILSLALSGLLGEKDFNTEENSQWLKKNFGVSISEKGILDLRVHFVEELRSLLNVCTSANIQCEQTVQLFYARYSKLNDWFLPKEKTAQEFWVQRFSNLHFEYYEPDPATFAEMERFEAAIKKYKETHALVFRLRPKLVPLDLAERELNNSLAAGFPAIAVIQPLEGGSHAEIATHRLPDGSVVTRNTAPISYRFFPWLSRPGGMLMRGGAPISKPNFLAHFSFGKMNLRTTNCRTLSYL